MINGMRGLICESHYILLADYRQSCCVVGNLAYKRSRKLGNRSAALSNAAALSSQTSKTGHDRPTDVRTSVHYSARPGRAIF